MIGCVFNTAVVKIETVDVYVCFHGLNTEAAMRRLRTRFAEATTGGYAAIIANLSDAVKQTDILFLLKNSISFFLQPFFLLVRDYSKLSLF